MSSSLTDRIRVLVVDDHPMMRDGIATALRAQLDLEVVGEANDGREAIEKFQALRPDVTLLDLNMPEMDGLQALVGIRQSFPDARIVVLTTYKGDALANRALKAGALGYLLKTSLRTDLVNAVRAAHAGQRYVPAEVAMAIAGHLGSKDLSPREIEILRKVASGLSNKQIAKQLGVSDDTIKAHLKSAFDKLNVNDRSHAVARALERGIFQL
jgi:DNA-binding NarL/FixJ family response regulator